MKKINGLNFEVMTKEDIGMLTDIMKRAFDEDSRRHLNKSTGGPPGYDNGEFLRKYGLNRSSQAFKVSNENRVIGAVIVWINDDHINYLGNMFVDVDYQDYGYGTKIWRAIEKMYPQTLIWKTDTPGFSKRNHNFYVNKCGFHVIKIENPMNELEENYVLEKIINR